jgi:hypothetical protein
MMAVTWDKQPSSRFGTTQLLQPSASSVSSSAFGAQTYQIRVSASATVNIKVGDGAQTATSADPLLPSTSSIISPWHPDSGLRPLVRPT